MSILNIKNIPTNDLRIKHTKTCNVIDKLGKYKHFGRSQLHSAINTRDVIFNELQRRITNE